MVCFSWALKNLSSHLDSVPPGSYTVAMSCGSLGGWGGAMHWETEVSGHQSARNSQQQHERASVIALVTISVCYQTDFLKQEGFPCGSAGKESACNEGDLSLIPGLGRSPGEGKGYPLQYSGLENSINCIVHGVTESQTRLSDFHFHFQSTEVHARLYQGSCCSRKKWK